MIPFSWKEYETGMYVVRTRNDKDVTQLHLFCVADMTKPPLVGIIDNDIYSWHMNGKWALSPNGGAFDLVLHAKTEKVMMQMWKDSNHVNPNFTYIARQAQFVFEIPDRWTKIGDHFAVEVPDVD